MHGSWLVFATIEFKPQVYLRTTSISGQGLFQKSLTMNHWRVKDQVIVITGASKGIGFATATVLLVRGAKVALLARNPQRLDEAVKKLASDNALGIAVDVS